MPSQTNEQALEATIEKSLTGICQEELKQRPDAFNEPPLFYRTGKGYYAGNPKDFNAKYAIDEVRFWSFLENTQKEELEKIQKQGDWKLKILERFDRLVKKYGVLRLLRKGLEVDDAHFTLFYLLPLSSSSDVIKANFEKNEFSITRQLAYSVDNPREEIDMVLFINGIPFSTMELKNHWTGQNAKVHGQEQYRSKRDIKQPLLQFGRCMVHFAVDTAEVYMTTKLDGKDTFFLPFNKGNNCGKGNPINPNGHKTAYLWEEILTRESVANILQHFLVMSGTDKDPLASKTLFFPRYHQLDVVRKLIKDAAQNGTGKTYLIQHSAGSGKSNSIAWAAYQLIETYPESDTIPGSKGTQNPLFDSVIVVTDRRLLDKQLRENIKEFSEVKNIVAPAFSSSDLRSALENGKKIIITTIQKFPFIVDGISDLSDKRFAVIIDEAHSSQGGTASSTMNHVMGKASDEDIDVQDKILAAIQARKMRGNASYFAFTATPKETTFEKFGIKNSDGKFEPFHLYSMKQAIEEGFILDVLANYTTLKSYYEIAKSIADNPLYDTMKAQKKLRAYVERHEQTIGTKAEIMLDNFLTKIVNTKKLKGKAKAMVVTQSIESAIRYYFALKTHLKTKGDPFKVLIAFSGEKPLDGNLYTEDNLNGFPEKDTKDKFDTDEYRILVVANKYLTGFDQPKLNAMYIDKKLQGVLAVQALSRLNRSANKLGKKTEDLFILDFFNTVDEIKDAFDPFYTSTSLSESTDVNVLHDLKSALDSVGVYEWHEVETFNELYFSGADATALSPITDLVSQRFNIDLELKDLEKADFKIKAKQFVKIYSQLASILEFDMIKWEKLFWLLKFTIPHFKIKDPKMDGLDELLNSVDLSTYGLERVRLNAKIDLDSENTELDPQNPNLRGAFGGDDEEDELEMIIKSFNERWFQGWDATPEDQRLKFISLSKYIMAHPDFDVKVVRNQDEQNRDIAFRKILDEIMSKQRKNELDLYRLYAKDETFYQAFFDTMKRMVSR